MPQEVDQWKEDIYRWKSNYIKNYNKLPSYELIRDWIENKVITPLQSKIDALRYDIQAYAGLPKAVIQLHEEKENLQSKIKEQSYHNEQKEIVLQEWINNYRKLESEITAKDRRIKELESQLKGAHLKIRELIDERSAL